MVSGSLLLVLLVLTCLQSFTTAENANGPVQCCFNYQTRSIPVVAITEYKETERHCTKLGVIFNLKRGGQVCADPGVQWVKNVMEKIDQRLIS